MNGVSAKPLDMVKGDEGVWTVTTDPIEPDFYGYSFRVDGVGTVDPMNAAVVPNLLGPSSMLHVPGPSPLPWEISDAPRGTLLRQLPDFLYPSFAEFVRHVFRVLFLEGA